MLAASKIAQISKDNELTPRPQIEIREAAAMDWPTVQAQCYPDHEPSLLRIHFDRALEQQARGRGCWLVATIKDVIVGAGQLSPYGRRLEIANVAVAPRWRKQGIGTRLVADLNRLAAAMGYRTVDISVAADNVGALRLYRRLGFEQCHYIRQGNAPAIVVLRADTEVSLAA